MIRGLRRTKDPMAAPPYLSHFKLRAAPFAADGDSQFFYADPERAQALNMLQHLTQYSEELLLVSGPAGSGKTSLLEQYLLRADDDWKVCRVSAAEISDPGQLFLTAARCFGLHTEGLNPDNVIDALREHLNQLQQSMTPVLVVDAAERLSDDGLEVAVRLAELAGDHGKLVRTILFAEPAITQQLAQPRFANMPKPHVLALKPLEEGQLPAYLHHRLTAAGYSGGPLFTARDIKRIYKGSQGWPGAVNAMAHEVLMDKLRVARPSRWRPMAIGGAVIGLAIGGYAALFTGGASIVSQPARPAAGGAPSVPGTVEKPIVRVAGQSRSAPASLTVRSGETLQITCAAPETVASVAQAATAPLGMPSPVPAASQGQAVSKPALPAVAAPRIETPKAETPKAETPKAETPKAEVPKAEVPKAEVPKAEVPKAEVPKAEVPKAEVPKAEVSKAKASKGEMPKTVAPKAVAMAPVIERIEPNPVPGSHRRQTLTLSGKHFTAHSQVTVAWDGRRERLPAARVHFVNSERMSVEIAVGTQRATWQLSVRGSGGLQSAPFRFHVEPAPAARTPAAKPGIAAFRDAAWVAARSRGHFTVQLVGATTEQGALTYLKGRRPAGDSALVVIDRNGKPWHVVLWGDFADRAAAEQAITRLPAALRRAGPWVRPFAELQRALRPADSSAR